MTLLLHIDGANEAFQGPQGPSKRHLRAQMAFLLRQLASKLEGYDAPDLDEGVLWDSNGNSVGRWGIVGEQPSGPETAEQRRRREERTFELATDMMAGLAMALGRRVSATPESPRLAIDRIMLRALERAEQGSEQGREV